MEWEAKEARELRVSQHPCPGWIHPGRPTEQVGEGKEGSLTLIAVGSPTCLLSDLQRAPRSHPGWRPSVVWKVLGSDCGKAVKRKVGGSESLTISGKSSLTPPLPPPPMDAHQEITSSGYYQLPKVYIQLVHEG